MSAHPLSPLVHPRTFCVIPHSTPDRQLARLGIHSPACRRVPPGSQTDLALMLGDHQPPETARFAVSLGNGSALWTPALRAGIEAPDHGQRDDGPAVFVLSDGRALAEQALTVAGARGMGPLAGVCVGNADPERLAGLAQGVLDLPDRPSLLVALHRRTSLELILALGNAPDRVFLLLVGEARRPLGRGPDGSAVLSPAALASALRLAVSATPGQLVEAAHLVAQGVTPGSPRVAVIAEVDDEASLLKDMLCAAGLEPTDGPAGVAVAGRPSSQSRRGTLLVRPSCWTRAPGPTDAGPDTLAALATLARLPGQPHAPGGRPRTGPGRATRLLDSWYRELSQAQLRPLLACYGICAAPGRLATSASMAGDVARQVGLPVVVEAVGPAFRGRAAGAMRRAVNSYSAARQAFRDVLLVCSRLHPSPVLDGVLVRAALACETTLRLSVHWTPLPLLLLGMRDTELVRLCPLSLAAAVETAGRLLEDQPPQGPAERRSLARLIHRLSWVGPDLAGRMCWLELERVSPPSGRRPPLVLEAHGEQTESLRKPLW